MAFLPIVNEARLVPLATIGMAESEMPV